jgi:hypothetical protein
MKTKHIFGIYLQILSAHPTNHGLCLPALRVLPYFGLHAPEAKLKLRDTRMG